MTKKAAGLAAAAALLCLGAAQALKIPSGASAAEISLPDGTVVLAELALTPEQQARGLMFREKLEDGRGMLFVFRGTSMRTFWMKNTFIDLDMVFIGGDLRVVKVFHRVPRSGKDQPDSEVARAAAPAELVLELPAGAARAHRVRPGSRIGVSFRASGK